MKFAKKVVDSVLFGGAVFVTSLFAKVVPCRVKNTFSGVFEWGFCSLNPDVFARSRSVEIFFGYTSSLTDAFFITFFLGFLLSMLFFHVVSHRKRHRK